MKIRYLATVLLLAHGAVALAHDPDEYGRIPLSEPASEERVAPAPDASSCARFNGQDATRQDLKDPAVKAAHDRCVAAGLSKPRSPEARR